VCVTHVASARNWPSEWWFANILTAVRITAQTNVAAE
jgi:hypothetical protein